MPIWRCSLRRECYWRFTTPRYLSNIASQTNATPSSAAVPRRRPTNCRPTGSPAAGTGIEIAGWPVTLNNCVSRRARRARGATGGPARDAATSVAPSGGDDRQRGKHERVAALERGVDGVDERSASRAPSDSSRPEWSGRSRAARADGLIVGGLAVERFARASAPPRAARC